MPAKVKTLVVDTSGFILNKPLWEYGEQLVSIKEVFDEIKDVAIRNYVLAFPVKVEFTQPKPQSLAFVCEFAKKTGDYYALSLTDLKVVALTYELEVAAKGDSHLRKQPERPKTNSTITTSLMKTGTESRPLEDLEEMEEGEDVEIKFGEHVDLEEVEKAAMEIVNASADKESSDDMEQDSADVDSGVEKEEEEEDDGWSMVARKNTYKKPRKFHKKAASIKNCDKFSTATSTTGKKHTHLPPGWYDAGDGFDGYLTPENYHMYKDELSGVMNPVHYEDEDQELDEDLPLVACMTGDFAMQNVCRHIGLTVFSPDGRMIKYSRCYVKRCFACFKVTSAMDKEFCPDCGNRSLKRVSMTINEDGSQHLWISSRPINTRGMIHNLPTPRGGKHAVMPLMTEDQRFPHQRPKKVKKLDLMNADVIDEDAPFSARDVSSAAFAHGHRETGQMGFKGKYTHARIWKPRRKTNCKK